MARRSNLRSWLVEGLLPWAGSCVVFLIVAGILRTGHFMFVVEAWLAFWVWCLAACFARSPSVRTATDAIGNQPQGDGEKSVRLKDRGSASDSGRHG